MLDIAEGTVSSRLSRARNKLQEELKGDEKR
jgi:RNA polymerase sigma-70 factor (ECF subfamily)